MNEMTLIRNRPNIGREQASESVQRRQLQTQLTIIMMKLALVLSTAICAVDASYKCVLDSEPFGWCGGDSWDGEWIAPDTAFSSAEDCFDTCVADHGPIVFSDYWTDNCDYWDDGISTGGCGCWCVYDCDEVEDVGMSGGILMGATDSACEIMTGFEATPMTPTTDACIYPPSGDDVANFVDDPTLKYSSEYVCASSWEYGSNFYDEDWYNGGCAGTLSGCSECTIGSYPACEAVDSSTGAYTGGWCYCEYAPTASPTPSPTPSPTASPIYVSGAAATSVARFAFVIVLGLVATHARAYLV